MVAPTKRKRHIPKPIKRIGLVLVLFLVVEYLVLPQIGGVWDQLHLLTRVDLYLAAAGIAAEGAALFAYAKLTQAVLPPGSRPPLGVLVRIDLATLSISHVVPGGTAAGAGLGYRLLTEEGVAPSNATFALGTQGLGSALVLNLLLWLGLVISIPLRGFNAIYATAAIVGALLIALFSALVIALTRGEERSIDLLRAIVIRLPLLRPDPVERFVRNLASRLRDLGNDPPVLRRAIGWAAANWLLDAACLWIFVYAFGFRLGVDGLIVSYGLANVLAAIPVTPSGLGVVEAVLIPSLVGFGAPHQAAILGVIAYRLVNFWLPIPVGAATYLSLHVGGESRDQRREKLLATASESIEKGSQDLKERAQRARPRRPE